MFGCFFAGWFGDTYGRKRGVWLGSIFCILGGALLSASINSDMFICSRVITGIGIGFVNTIIPPWVSELARAHNRGVHFTYVFISNCRSHLLYTRSPVNCRCPDIGIIIAYWVNYGVSYTVGAAFKWRFPLAFMTM